MWHCGPVEIWTYRLGGYQVLKKWLSYRERDILGRWLHPEEVQHREADCGDFDDVGRVDVPDRETGSDPSSDPRGYGVKSLDICIRTIYEQNTRAAPARRWRIGRNSRRPAPHDGS